MYSGNLQMPRTMPISRPTMAAPYNVQPGAGFAPGARPALGPAPTGAPMAAPGGAAPIPPPSAGVAPPAGFAPPARPMMGPAPTQQPRPMPISRPQMYAAALRGGALA